MPRAARENTTTRLPLHRTPGKHHREPSRGGDDRTHLCGSTASRTPPSRTWRCQSSGRVMTSCSCCCGVAAMAVALRFGRGEARKLTRQGGDSRRKGADEGFVCGCAQTVVVMAACIGFARFILVASPVASARCGLAGGGVPGSLARCPALLLDSWSAGSNRAQSGHRSNWGLPKNFTKMYGVLSFGENNCFPD